MFGRWKDLKYYPGSNQTTASPTSPTSRSDTAAFYIKMTETIHLSSWWLHIHFLLINKCRSTGPAAPTCSRGHSVRTVNVSSSSLPSTNYKSASRQHVVRRSQGHGVSLTWGCVAVGNPLGMVASVRSTVSPDTHAHHKHTHQPHTPHVCGKRRGHQWRPSHLSCCHVIGWLDIHHRCTGPNRAESVSELVSAPPAAELQPCSITLPPPASLQWSERWKLKQTLIITHY